MSEKLVEKREAELELEPDLSEWMPPNSGTYCINDKYVVTRDLYVKLQKELDLALHYLWLGKQQFTPNTDNSDVDCFLYKHGVLHDTRKKEETISLPPEVHRGFCDE